MPLSAESEAVIQSLIKANLPPLHSLPAAEGRAVFGAAFKTKSEEQAPIARVENTTIPVEGGTLRVRCRRWCTFTAVVGC